ncbi:hypothetical protein CRM22_003163 [Opisthorchis felineus]|uniref:Uncharacterized protein n=1 Tax=Opisthorchis felineus TaxID=147828 RepID=A0A4V3SG03_OPIFE|nr:hypothetical protein CRM22_003163 [Opisthorchis felineus]
MTLLSLFRYENCWPAVFKGSHGVMFVYSPDHSEHSRELEDWWVLANAISTALGTQGHIELSPSKTHAVVSSATINAQKLSVISWYYV